MPTCTHCHNPVQDEDRICPHCGYTFIQSQWKRWCAARIEWLKRHAISCASILIGLAALGCRILAFGLRSSSTQLFTAIGRFGGVGLGIVAVALAFTGWSREDRRYPSVMAIAFGLSALFPKYALILLILLGIALILASLQGHL